MSLGDVFRRPVPSAQDARDSLRTVRDLLRFSTSRLAASEVAFGQGTLDARDEAAWLLLWSLHLPPHELDFWLDARLTQAERDAALELLRRRCDERIPAAWLTGEAWLRGLRFLSDSRALVPRSPIAELLDSSDENPLLDEIARLDDDSDGVEAIDATDVDTLFDEPVPWSPQEVLDLCTGGGSLAVFAALRFPDARVSASDIDADALALAQENFELHGLAQRIEALHGDLFEALPQQRRFDLILCNPPYVCEASMQTLPPEFRAEPQHALAGGPDGMRFIRRLLAQAGQRLRPRGLLLVEVGHEADHFEAAFPELEFIWLPVQAGDRMVAAIHARHLPGGLQLADTQS